MLQIVGFGQVFRLDRGMQPINEMQVQDAGGVVHRVEITQAIIEQLVKVWVAASRAAGTAASYSPPDVPARQVHYDPVMAEPVEEPDAGEIFGGDQVVRAPLPPQGATEAVVERNEMGYPVRSPRVLPRPAFVGTPQVSSAQTADDDGNQI